MQASHKLRPKVVVEQLGLMQSNLQALQLTFCTSPCLQQCRHMLTAMRASLQALRWYAVPAANILNKPTPVSTTLPDTKMSSTILGSFMR